MTEMFELNDEQLEDVVGGAKKRKSSASSATVPTQVKIVNCDFVRLRNAAGGGQVIGQIKVGTIVPCLGLFNNYLWANVQTPDGKIGYIYKDYFTEV